MPTQREQERTSRSPGRRGLHVNQWLRSQGLLTLKDGAIRHVTDGIPEVLVPNVEPFQWYRFEVVYDVGRGTYDLRLGIGDDPPIVTKRNQPNAPGAPGSGVSIFSFIGDLRDRSSVRYYIDSLNIGRNDLFARPTGAGPAVPPRQSLVDREIELLRTKLDALEPFLLIRGASERAAVNDPYVADSARTWRTTPIARCAR
jgi:hypothetical protein